MTFEGICGRIGIACNGMFMDVIVRGRERHGNNYAENIGFDFGGNEKSL